MTTDKETAALVEALKLALAEPGEQRLFRRGKLPGLFATRKPSLLQWARRRAGATAMRISLTSTTLRAKLRPRSMALRS